ncbi:uncharacterized protein LOC132060558 [Lycium ferocissimum]|uniref:uncharacterized protein LOC132060558 n=1 Tax=Lycium ferocissimum TaxID=112874 RepID=UPI002815E781|nr:uncharacterized protein LOC132060558 [Lycium ferocissimum]
MCVSKEWYSLLSDPQFIKAHLTMINSQKHEEKLIVVYDSQSIQAVTFNQNGNKVISRKLNFQQLLDDWATIGGGSSDGLALVVNGKMMKYFINPTTLKCQKIPNYSIWLFLSKVVTLSCFDIYEPDIVDTFVDVYSLRKGLWRRLESSPYGSEVLVDGVLHLLANKTSDCSSVMVAFSSDKEFFVVPWMYSQIYTKYKT